MNITVGADVEVIERPEATRAGSTRRQWLLTDEAKDGLNLRLFRSHYEGGKNTFATPRHHHPFQQIRWAQSGFMNYAPNQDIQEGDVAYFPRGTFYGPQVRDQGIGITLQFGFRTDLLSIEEYEKGVQGLKKRGTIKDGIFIDTDATGAERRKDINEAVEEEHTKQPFTSPEAEYEYPILMHNERFPFYGIAPGVEEKMFGAFYNLPGSLGDVRLSMIRLQDGGVYQLGRDRAQLLWSKSAGLCVEGKTYPELTCIHSPRDEEAFISGANGVEVWVVELPQMQDQ